MFECCQQRHPLSARLQTLGQQGRKWPPVPLPGTVAGRCCAYSFSVRAIWFKVAADPAVFGGQLPDSGKQLVVDRGNGYDGAYGCPPYGLPDKLGLADVVRRKPLGKLGVFFLGHAGL